jgi:hypothetical protein
MSVSCSHSLETLGMFIALLHVPNSNGSLVMAIKTKAKYKFIQLPPLFYILQRNYYMKSIIFWDMTLGTTLRTTWRHIPEDDTLQNHCCENLKSYKLLHIFIRSIAIISRCQCYCHLRVACPSCCYYRLGNLKVLGLLSFGM